MLANKTELECAMKNTLRKNSPCLSNLKLIGFLILSAVLLHFSAFAECGPYGEGQCGECGPHWSDWYAEQCPTNSNIPSVTPSWYGCVQTGQSPPQPTVVPPTFAGGRKARVAWYDCSTNLNYQYQGITYTVGAVQWEPPLPGTFNISHVPSFSSSAYVTITSSDPTNCPAPVDEQGRYWIGGCTWNVVDAGIYLSQVPFDYWPSWAEDLKNLLGYNINLPTLGPLAGYHQTYQHGYCCNDAIAYVTYQKLGFNGSANFSLDVGSATLRSLAESVVGAALDLAGLGGLGLEGPATSFIDTFGFSATTLGANGSTDWKSIHNYTDGCTCWGTSATYGSHTAQAQNQIGIVDIPESVFAPLGYNFSIHIIALDANLLYQWNEYDLYSGGNTTEIPHFYKYRRLAYIYTRYQIGLFQNKVAWSELDENPPASQTGTVCVGNEYPG